MTDLHEQIRKALAVLPPITSGVCDGQTEVCIGKWMLYLGFDAESAAIGDALTSAPQWLAALLDDVKTLTAERDRYLHALELVAPDGRGLQLFLGEGPAPGMPMYGSVCTESPYLIATKPEGPDASFAGAREVYQYTYDEDTQREAEHCAVGYFVTEDWLCERDAGAEEKNREAPARAEAAERERDEALSGEADAVRRAESAELGCEIAYRREPTQAEGDAHEADHGCDCCDDDCQRCAHLSPQGIKSGECFVAMGGWTGRRCRVCRRWVWGGPTACVACVAAEERDSLLAENARLREERDARPTITREDAKRWAFSSHPFYDGHDPIRLALRAHASQPQCSSCHGTRTVMDADHDSRVLTADDCPACSQPKGDGGCDV